MDLQKIEEYRKCATSFKYFAETYLKILHPKRGLIPLGIYPFQERLFNDFENERFVIHTKFRGGGFTTFTACYCFWKCMFNLDQSIIITGPRDADAVSINERIIKPLYYYLPEWLRPELERHNKHHIEFRDTSSRMYFHDLSPAKGRALTHLVIDECAFVNNMEFKWKCFYPTLSCGGKCFINSTTNGVGNWFQETYHAAQDKKNAFKVYQAHYTEHPDFNSPEWAKAQRECLGEEAWHQEVLQDFVISDRLP